jgi:hypothetical protein
MKEGEIGWASSPYGREEKCTHILVGSKKEKQNQSLEHLAVNARIILKNWL